MKENPECKLLVVGDMNDNPNSAAFREMTGKRKKNLFDLRPADPQGDVWTYYQKKSDTYLRIDYFLLNATMLKDADKTRSKVVRDPLTYKASDHRPIISFFKTEL